MAVFRLPSVAPYRLGWNPALVAPGGVTATDIVDVDSGAGVESVGPIAAALPQSDSGAGVDAIGSIAAALAPVDIGSGVESVGPIAAALPQSDSGAGVDAIGPLVVSSSLLDAGISGDAVGPVDAALALTDSGAVTEALEFVDAAIVLTDSGAATDAQAPVEESLASTDSGAVTEALEFVDAAIVLADSGEAVEAQAPVDAAISQLDTGAVSDFGLLDVASSAIDIFGAADDATALELGLNTVDIGSGVEWSGTPEPTGEIPIQAVDAGAWADDAIDLTQECGAADAGESVEAQVTAAALARIDSGAAVEKSIVRLGLPFSDNFTRADNVTLGSPWVLMQGNWGITSNQARCNGTGGYDSVAVDAGASDVTVSVTVPTLSANAAIVFRATDVLNFLNVTITPTSMTINRRVGGTVTAIGTAYSGTFVSGDTIFVTCIGASITCYQNGALRRKETSTFNQTATKHGLMQYFDAGSRYSAFSIDGASTTVTPFSLTDSGMGADSALALIWRLAGIESGLLTESIAPVTALLSQLDTGAVFDSGLLDAASSAIDIFGAADDATALELGLNTVDIGSGAEWSGTPEPTGEIPIQAVDAGAWADDATALEFGLNTIDIGSGAESDSGLLDAASSAIDIFGAADDATALEFGLNTIDIGSGAEWAGTPEPTGEIPIQAVDAGAWADDATALTLEYDAADAGLAVEANLYLDAVTTADDTGAGSESVFQTATCGTTDSGTIVDSSSALTWELMTTDAGAGFEFIAIPLVTGEIPAVDFDAGTGIEATAPLTWLLSGSDVGTTSEVEWVPSALGASDTGAESETSSLGAFLGSSDVVVGVESLALTWGSFATDFGASSDAIGPIDITGIVPVVAADTGSALDFAFAGPAVVGYPASLMLLVS